MTKKIVSMALLAGLVCAIVPVPALANEYHWDANIRMPSPKVDAAAVVVNNEIFVIGGADNHNGDNRTSENYKYNTEDGTWEKKGNLPKVMSNASAVAIDGKVYVLGGRIDSGGASNPAIYSCYPSNYFWGVEVEKMPSEFYTGLGGGAAFGKDIYLFLEKKIVIYNVETKEFRKIDSPVNVSNRQLVIEYEGKMYIFGSQYIEGGAAKLHIYDCATDTWTTGEDLPVSLIGMGAFAKDGKIFAMGGYDVITRQSQKDIYIYDIASNTWTQGGPSLINGRCYFQVVYANDTVYVIGGENWSSSSYPLVYDVETISYTDLCEASGIIPMPDYRAYIEMNKGETLNIALENGSPSEFTWYSNNTSAVAINNGVITAVDTGIAYLEIESRNGLFKLNIPVKVIDGSAVTIPVTGVAINPSSILLEVDDTCQLDKQVYPADATNQQVTWLSDDSSVADVDANGTITAIAPGTAEITVTTIDGGYTDTCFVTVEEAVVIPPVEPENLALSATASSNSELNNNRSAAKANDGDATTSWMAKADDEYAYLLLTFDEFTTFNEIVIDAAVQRIGDYIVELWDGSSWIEVDRGFGMGRNYTLNLGTSYTGTGIMITMTSRYSSSANAYALYEVEVYNR